MELQLSPSSLAKEQYVGIKQDRGGYVIKKDFLHTISSLLASLEYPIASNDLGGW